MKNSLLFTALAAMMPFGAWGENEDVGSRSSSGFYSINFDKKTSVDTYDNAFNGRYLKHITLDSPTFGTQVVYIGQMESKKLYTYVPDAYFMAKAGETVSVSVDWLYGAWMHAYVYLDRDNNGQFEAAVKKDGYTPKDGCDLMTFSAIEVQNVFFDSNGKVIPTKPAGKPMGHMHDLPDFTIPADLKSGVYRMRYKLDWNSIDPGGSTVHGNDIVTDHGAIADIILIISDGSDITINSNQQNGNVTTETGEPLNNYKAKIGEPFKVKLAPDPGYWHSGMKVRCGVLSGDSLYHDNPMYRDTVYEYDSFNNGVCLTIPGEFMNGDVSIEGYFVKEELKPQEVKITYNLLYDERIIATQYLTGTIGQPAPPVEWKAKGRNYWHTSGFQDIRVTGPMTMNITLGHHYLPFEISKGYNEAHWYNLCIGDYEDHYLSYNDSSHYVDLSDGTTTPPAADDYNSQWAFVGNMYEGFKIINRGAGESKVLSAGKIESNMSIDSIRIYTEMRNEPVLAFNSMHWVPGPSTDDSFLLSLIGDKHISYYMCMYNSLLALPTFIDGVPFQSKIRATLVESTTGIDDITTSDKDTDVDIEYYNLQGIRIKAENIRPGIYIRRQGTTVTKVLIR